MIRCSNLLVIMELKITTEMKYITFRLAKMRNLKIPRVDKNIIKRNFDTLLIKFKLIQPL